MFVAFTAKMEGPSKGDLAFKDNDDGTVTATYKPTEAGTYKLILKFTHFNLPGKIKSFSLKIVRIVFALLVGTIK